MSASNVIDITEYYGEKELRWCQIAARNETIQHLRNGVRRVLICKPTGVGKTITIACTLDCVEMREALGITEDRPLRVFFMAHVQRLLTQAERTFADSNNVDIRIGTPFVDINPDDIEWSDVVVIDEAHHEAMMSFQYQLDTMCLKPIIGLTATKDRADGMIIKFEEIVEPISREQAVKEGFLAETSLWSFVDTSGKDKTKIVKDVLNTYAHLMAGTMVFMATKKEAQAISDHINAMGYRSVALLNQTKRQVDDVLDQFSRGEIDFIVNCFKLGEGVDTMGCTSVLMGRNVNSYPLLNQVIGRAARPDSECQVFELVNPLSGNNLDTTVVVGTPKRHVLCSAKGDGTFTEREFDYVGHNTGIKSGVKPQYAMFG